MVRSLPHDQPDHRRAGRRIRRPCNIGKCDVDNNDDIVGKFMVRNIPTIVFIKGGQVVDKQVGACTKADLVKKLEKLL